MHQHVEGAEQTHVITSVAITSFLNAKHSGTQSKAVRISQSRHVLPLGGSYLLALPTVSSIMDKQRIGISVSGGDI
jgi:hypothetical protein